MKHAEINNRFSFIRDNQFYFELVTIKHEHFYRFYKLFNKFLFMTRKEECIEDDYWNFFIKVINDYRYKCALLPTSFNNSTSVSPEDSNKMLNSINSVSERYPDFKNIINEIIISWNYLRSLNENPYANEIIKLCKKFNNQEVSLVLKNYEIDDNEKNSLTNFCSNLTFKNLRDYKKQNNIDDISIFLGSRAWYDNDIFTMPVSRKIFFIGYEGIYRPKKDIPVFSSLLWSPYDSQNKNSIEVLDQEHESSIVEVEEDRPERIHDDVSVRIYLSDGTHSYAEKSDCRKVTFKSGHVCFLRNDEHDHSQQLLLIDNDAKQIKSEKVENISTGDFVLLRMEGLGDEIINEANKDLGTEYVELRNIQKKWKLTLRNHIEKHGSERLINTLKNEGINAYTSKLRYWAYDERNIKTKNPNDFYTLMSILGISKTEYDKWFVSLKKIDRAHRKVQPRIRKKILGVIEEADLSNLFEMGFQEFSLPHTSSKLGIFEVTRISSENIQMPVSIMDKPLSGNM